MNLLGYWNKTISQKITRKLEINCICKLPKVCSITFNICIHLCFSITISVYFHEIEQQLLINFGLLLVSSFSSIAPLGTFSTLFVIGPPPSECFPEWQELSLSMFMVGSVRSLTPENQKRNIFQHDDKYIYNVFVCEMNIQAQLNSTF